MQYQLMSGLSAVIVSFVFFFLFSLF